MGLRNKALSHLLSVYREDGAGENRDRWVCRCEQFFSSPDRPPILNLLGDQFSIALHGSTTRNVDDPYSDIDCYLLLDPPAMARLDSTLGSRFIDIEIDGKPGHLNAKLFSEIDDAFAEPNLETIYELRNAVAMLDPANRFASVTARAQRPMDEAIRRAALLRCSVEMRSFHRSADNPMDRHDKWSTLSSVVEAVNYALRCAIVLDGRPYPYVKWLYIAAAQCDTGKAVLAHVDNILRLVQTDLTALTGPEKRNEVSMVLRRIRAVIVERAKATGIDEEWLTRWWHHLDASAVAFDGVEW